jgi:hypothetical protein
MKFQNCPRIPNFVDNREIVHGQLSTKVPRPRPPYIINFFFKYYEVTYDSSVIQTIV